VQNELAVSLVGLAQQTAEFSQIPRILADTTTVEIIRRPALRKIGMTDIRIGTSTFTAEGLIGSFYPASMPCNVLTATLTI